MKIIFVVIVSMLFISCEKKKVAVQTVKTFNQKDIVDNPLFTIKPIPESGNIPLIKGIASCFFGDLDAAEVDMKRQKKSDYWLTIERLNPDPEKHEVVFSKKVNRKTFDEPLNINVRKFLDGPYGFFLCSGEEAQCLHKGKMPVVVNDIFKEVAQKQKVDTRPKLYSANFFIKNRGEIIGRNKLDYRDKVRRGSLLKLYKSLYGDENGKLFFTLIDPIFEKLKPQPVFLSVNLNTERKKDEVVFEIPAVSSDCNTQMLLNRYK